MKNAVRDLTLASAMLWLCAMAATAQDKPQDPGTPGSIHQHMAQCAGDYTTETRFVMKPGEKGEASTGTAKITVVLGGRFLQEEASGTMMGQPYTSLKLMGYNNGTEQFEAVWTYTRSTGIMNLTGKSSDGGKTVNWTATYEQKKGEKTTLHVDTKHLSKDQFVVELFSKNPDGSRGPTMETTYTRKK
jgi:hypothetical protein